MSYLSRLVDLRLLLVFAFLAIAGCGAAEYEKRFNATKTEMDRRVKFGVDLDQTSFQIIDQPWKMRLPKFLTKPTNPSFSKLLAVRGGAGNPKVEKEEIVQPPIVKLPGIVMSFQATAVGDNTRLPYALYVAVEPITAAADRLTLDKIRDDIKAYWTDRPAEPAKADGKEPAKEAAPAQPPKPVEWSPIEIESLAGGKMKWEKLSASGPLSFTYYGNVTPNTGPAVFDLYKYEGEGFRVFVGWLVFQTLIDNGNVKLEKFTVPMLGTLEFTGQKQAPAKK